MKDHLKTIADFHQSSRGMSLNESFVRAVVVSRRGTIQPPKAGSLSIVTVAAEVNAGRWIVRCPFCRGAELADPNDPRFYCLSCGNAAVFGEWLQVSWPLQKEAIEAVLLNRPTEETRNWTAAETVQDLQAENHKQGIGD